MLGRTGPAKPALTSPTASRVPLASAGKRLVPAPLRGGITFHTAVHEGVTRLSFDAHPDRIAQKRNTNPEEGGTSSKCELLARKGHGALYEPGRATADPCQFALPGVGEESTWKSEALLSVSFPLGVRANEESYSGASGAAPPSISPLLADPYPMESTVSLVLSCSATPPPAEARPEAKVWSALPEKAEPPRTRYPCAPMASEDRSASLMSFEPDADR